MDCFGKSQKAAEETKIATAREKISIRVTEIATDIISKENRNLKVEDLLEIENNEITVQKNTDGTIYTEVDEENKEYVIAECDGYKFKVYANGEVELYTDEEIVQITYKKTSISEDRKKITILITVTGNKGLEKVIKSDGIEIYSTENQKQIAMDFTADSGVDYIFKAIGKGGTEKTKIINVTAGDIYTIEELENMSLGLNISYRLMKNLNFNDINSYETQEKYDYYNRDIDEDGKLDNSWEPIGNYAAPFTGTFDGQYYTISNLYINSITDYIGLFGYQGSGKIMNLYLKDVNINSTMDNVGGLVGRADGSIDQVRITGNITGRNNVGGLFGCGYGYGTISKISSWCNVTGTNCVGGICGHKYADLQNCYSRGEIIGTNGQSSGIHCGIPNGSMKYCYAACKMNGNEKYGLHAYWEDMTSSYWDAEVSGAKQDGWFPDSGKTTAEMQTQSTYADWDFNTIWEMDSDTGYPRLQWEKNKN